MNPNLDDVPEQVQQVMSSPTLITADSSERNGRRPVMNGVNAPTVRGPVDVDDEVIIHTEGLEVPGPQASSSTTGQATSSSSSRPEHFLSTDRSVSREVTGGQEPRRSGFAARVVDGASAKALGETLLGKAKASPPGAFLSEVARAVTSIPATIEGMVQRSATGNHGSPGTTSQGQEGFASAQSGSPGDRRPPPSEGQVPPTPLFDAAAMTRLNELHSEAPHLYPGAWIPTSAERHSSTPSSDIQAEVRRQLSELMAMHEDESTRLRRQVEVLATENRELRSHIERTIARPPPPGSENSGFPGLGWFGRGIGSILGGSQRAGTPIRSPGLGTNPGLGTSPGLGTGRSPDPPPPGVPKVTMPHVTQALDPDLGPTEVLMEPPELPVSRTLTFDETPAVPIASAKPPPSVGQPPERSGHGPTLDPLSVVLTGMAQLQGVVSELAASPKAAVAKNETVKSGTTTLPDLPNVNQEACLEFSDWLHNSRPALADVSDSSEELWSCVVSEAKSWYAQYLKKPPLERLTMKPEPSSTLLQPKWGRVSRRMESMIIAACPGPVKEELSAARVSGILPVLCRLFIIYAPGGLMERELGLKQVQDPPVATNPKDAVQLLRKWQRWSARLKELGGTLPDSALRVRALEKMTRAVLASHPDIGFKINLTKAALQVDSTPDDHKVEQLHAQLLSELEMVSHRAAKDADKPRDPLPQGNPKIKGVDAQDALPPKGPKGGPKANPKTPNPKDSQSGGTVGTGKPQCTFYLSANGCKKGADCTFTHDWNQIPQAERHQRCKTCGGKGHRMHECKSGLKGDDKAKARPQTRNQHPKAPSDVPAPPPPPSRDAVLKSMLADAASILQQTVPVQTTGVPSPDFPLAGSPKAKSSSSSAGTGATPQANAVTAGMPVTIESIAAQLEGLRAMARGFEAKACRVDEMIFRECEVNRVLLDSGATHPVIPYREDLKELEKVSVTLAGDGRQQWLRTKGGTLVVPPLATAAPGADPPQTIVPLGALVMSLGCTVTWSRHQGLKVVHPRLGRLKTGVAKNTCPYMQERQALELISELETSKLKEFEQQVQTLECELQSLQSPTDPTEALRNYVSSGKRSDALKAVFCQPYLEDVPEAVKVRLAESIPLSDQSGKHVIKRLPLPRPARRSLLASPRWVVHLCSGETGPNDPIRRWSQDHSCEVLQLDVQNTGGKGWDLTIQEGVWSVLLWAAATGRIAAILSSPPHRTWKPGEHASLDQGEQRTQENPWASGCTSERTIRESLLAVQDMYLWSLASIGRGGGIPYLREFIDPSSDKLDPKVNFWDTNAWIHFQQWSGARRRFLETGTNSRGVVMHLSVGTNLDIPDAILPLTKVPLDPNSKWTMRFKSYVLDALEGKVPHTDLEDLDRKISEGLSSVRLEGRKDEGSGIAALSMDPTRTGNTDMEAEERSIRMFEDESAISSSEEEVVDEDDEDDLCTRAVQSQAEKRRIKELDAWRLHLENGHVPFRKDCRHCVLGSAVSMQHRRVKHPASYTLSVDLFGPLQPHERGRDEESVSANPHIKYGLIGAFRLPKEVTDQNGEPNTGEDQPKVLPEDHLSDYEPSDPEEEQPCHQPVHDTLGEISNDLFEELFGEAFLPNGEANAVEALDSESPLPMPTLPWDDEYLPPDDDLLQEFAEELKTPVEQVVLRFFVGLKSKSGADVAAAVQRLVLHINQSYPVRVLHCDPGTEFASDRLRAWLAGQAVRLQHTLPTDKRSNGLAERTVGVLKSQARTHLSSAKLHVSYWPLAMRYACEMHNRRVLGKPSLPIFGQQVLHKV